MILPQAAATIDTHNNQTFDVNILKGRKCLMCLLGFESEFPNLFADGATPAQVAAENKKIFKYSGCDSRCTAFMCRSCAIYYLENLPERKFKCPLCGEYQH